MASASSIASSATDWKAKEQKWENGIDPATATNKDLTDYLLFKLWQYKDNELMDVALWSIFGDDFVKFDPGIFLKINALHLRKMYDFLRKGGVYVQTKKGRATYAQLLYDVLQEKEQYTWTQKELDEVYNELALTEATFSSIKLNNALKRGLDYKYSSSSSFTPQAQAIPLQPVQPAQTALPAGGFPTPLQPVGGSPPLPSEGSLPLIVPVGRRSPSLALLGAGHPPLAQTTQPARDFTTLVVQPAEGFPSLVRPPQPTA